MSIQLVYGIAFVEAMIIDENMPHVIIAPHAFHLEPSLDLRCCVHIL